MMQKQKQKMMKKIPKNNKPIASSELLFIENIIIAFILLFPLFLYGLNNVKFTGLIILFVIIYFSTTLFIRKIYIFSDYLIIKYPTRLLFRERGISYSRIEKIIYIYGNSAYSIPEIRIKIKRSIIPVIYITLSYKKRKEVLQKFFELGLSIEINSKYYKDKNILKD